MVCLSGKAKHNTKTLRIEDYDMNEQMKSGLKEYRRKLESGEIEKAPAKNPTEKWQENPYKIRLAVNAMCVDCCGGVEETNWLKRIRYCQILKCPLHKVRPYSKGITDDECVTWVESST